MRRAEHERIVGVLITENERLRQINEDLLNRCMSKDWAQYTALSAEPYNPPDPGEWIFDATGLVAVEREGEPGSL